MTFFPWRSYRYCEEITWREAKNFAFAFWFLPPPKQRAMFAVYAFSRVADDIVDDEGKKQEERLKRLRLFRKELRIALEGIPRGNLFPALRHTVDRFSIPHRYFYELLEGMEMDLVKNRYDTFSELWEYCYRAASVVGLITIEIFGYKSEKAKEYAVDMGQALQLTNILRDVEEDLQRGRIYLPKEGMRRFSVSEEELFQKELTPRIQALLHFLCEKAKEYYSRSRRLFPLIFSDSRFCPESLWEIYFRLLEKMEEMDFAVFGKRVSLSKGEKVKIALKNFGKSFFR